MTRPAPPRRGVGLLLASSLIWGVAYIPQSMTVAQLDAFWACALRFVLAVPFAIGITRGRLRTGLPWRLSLGLGALLYAAFFAQTQALRHTPVSRVSLLTGLYALFTPWLAPLFGLRRPGRLHFAGAALALLGLAGLTGIRSTAGTPFNVGDALTLLHALLSAFHILLVGRFARQADPLALNAVQICALAGLALPVALVVGAPSPDPEASLRTALAFLYLAVFSSVIAFALQLVGQRSASPSLCALIFLLESPIGVVCATLWLGESLTGSQWLGALVLLGGIALSVWAEARGLPTGSLSGTSGPRQPGLPAPGSAPGDPAAPDPARWGSAMAPAGSATPARGDAP